MPSPTRRRVVAAIGAASAGIAGCPVLESPTRDLGRIEGRWPMVGRDPAHTRRFADGPTDPTTAWTADLDDARSAGTPALADGRLYVPVDAVSDRARHRYRVHELSAATGDERWRVPLRVEPNGPPATVGDRTVVTAKRSIERGRIVCFRTRYGEESWLVDVDARLTAPPTVAGGTAYVPDWSGRVHALDLADGERTWSRQVATGESSRTFASPAAVEDGTLYVGSLSGTTGVVALDAETGDERWRTDTPAVTDGPVVDGDRLVVRSHGLVVALDAGGERRWSYNVPEADPHPMAVDGAGIYVPRRDGLVAITRDGREAWTYESPDGQVGTPTAVGDRVFLRGPDRLVALSRADGTVRWTASPPGVGRAVVTPRGIFLSGDGGRVLALGGG